MNENIKSEQMDALCKALVALRTEEEAERFLDDLCTISELLEFSKRLEVARLLREGVTYSEICSKTGLSTATITRVNRCLKYGSGGYKVVLDRLEEEQ